MYKEVYAPKHPNARPNGCVNEHILIAEKILGRYLVDEVVHHIDENKSNNDPKNLMIFDSQNSHARYHTGIYSSIICSDNIYTCKPKMKLCPNCNTLFEQTRLNQKNICCSVECSSKLRQKKDRPNKIILEKLLNKYNFTKVGKIFKVSDNTIRKWCKSYGLSTKAKDYK